MHLSFDLDDQSMQYCCPFCGKTTVKRQCAGIWNCRACKKVMTGGAYMLSTPAAAQVRTTLNRVKNKAIEAAGPKN
jgi:large subunit ribosomal protein L37Ae